MAKYVFHSSLKRKRAIYPMLPNRRFDSDFLTVQKVIESGKLGDILEVEMHYDYFRRKYQKIRMNFLLQTAIYMDMLVIQ